MRTIGTALLLLTLTAAAHATPVTIDEFLAQDPKQPTGSVTIVETQECCEEKKGVPWWPFLFAGAIPLAFIDWSDDTPPEILLPPVTTPTPGTTPAPVPEPSTLSLGLLAAIGLLVRKRPKTTAP